MLNKVLLTSRKPLSNKRHTTRIIFCVGLFCKRILPMGEFSRNQNDKIGMFTFVLIYALLFVNVSLILNSGV